MVIFYVFKQNCCKDPRKSKHPFQRFKIRHALAPFSDTPVDRRDVPSLKNWLFSLPDSCFFYYVPLFSCLSRDISQHLASLSDERRSTGRISIWLHNQSRKISAPSPKSACMPSCKSKQTLFFLFLASLSPFLYHKIMKAAKGAWKYAKPKGPVLSQRYPLYHIRLSGITPYLCIHRVSGYSCPYCRYLLPCGTAIFPVAYIYSFPNCKRRSCKRSVRPLLSYKALPDSILYHLFSLWNNYDTSAYGLSPASASCPH